MSDQWTQRQSDRVRDQLASAIIELDPVFPASSDEEIQDSPPKKKSRFVHGGTNLKLQDIRSFVQSMQNENTSKKTAADMRIVETFKLEIGEQNPIEEMSAADLDLFLCKFFMSVRKSDGEEYEPDSLTCIQSSLSRYLKSKGSVLSLRNDPHLSTHRDVLAAKRRELKQKGKGLRSHKSEDVSADQLDVLYEKGLLGISKYF